MADPNKKNRIDLDKILLPKKEVPSLDSAQRVNAAALLEQEQSTTLPKPEPQVAEPRPKIDDSAVKPLQTYQGDIESLVESKKVSVVSIAAAEAERNASTPGQKAPDRSFGELVSSRTSLYAGGGVLILLALGALAYVFLQGGTVAPAPAAPAPFLFVDETQAVQTTTEESRDELMSALVAAKGQVRLSVGLVARLAVAAPVGASDSAASESEMDAQTFLQIIAPDIPQNFLRTVEPRFLLGVHSYDENAPFLILKVDSYETAYSGLLTWESTLYGGLLPLFARNPSPRANSDTASSSTHSTFIDAIVENRDARAVKNSAGDILLLWTFLDRRTVVITTNNATLREVISRLSLPQQ